MSGRPFRLAVWVDASIVGGAERITGDLLAHLGPHVDATLVGTHREVLEQLAARRPGTCTRLVSAVRHKRDLGAMRRFAAALRAVRPDVLQVNLPTPWMSRHETMLALAMPGVRVVAVEYLPVEAPGPWIRWLKRQIARRLDAHVGLGDGACRKIELLAGLRRGSVVSIPVGVEEFAVERERAGRQRPLVGTTARFDVQKGLDVLLEAVALLPELDLELVGDGPERDALQRQAAALGISERVEFAGWSQEPRRHLARWDAFVLPSRYEGQPVAILDAMLAELPVVATGVGSVSEAVRDGETGLLVPVDDPHALAAALRRLVAEPELARRLGARGRALALERHTVAAMARRYEELYRDLLERP